MKKIYLFLVAAAMQLNAQDVPVPAPAQLQPILIKNATIHIGDGTVIDKGDVLFDNGKIVDVGSISSKLQNVKEIDATGKHVYPGLIAANTWLGLIEIEAARATNDNEEVGSINPNVRAIVGYNTDSRVIPTVRANGILIAQIAPAGGLLSGQSSIVQLDAWNWEDATFKADDAVFMDWPRMTFSASPFALPIDVQKKNSERALIELSKAMEDARAYMTAKDAGKVAAIDQRWEAIEPVLKKQKPFFIHLHDAKQITAACAFAKKNDVNIVLVGATAAWQMTAFLKENNIPIIIEETHRMPDGEDEDTDMPYKLPKILKDAGIKFCLSMNGAWQQRNLMFQAGSSAGYGLTKEDALMSVTKNAAEILGIGERVGTIEKGKDATLVVSEGDILDMKSSIVDNAFIQGRMIDLGNRHKDLYKKFKAKYEGLK